jgi:bifunctional UDP-N-acetylglucosamine pyrophosphorylase/glucosamine-1-phosphate N-acetyltransferase
MKKICAIVLAAGKGTRLAEGSPSPRPKVLYEIGGRPIILYTLDLLKKIGLREIILVLGHKAGEVKSVVGRGYKFAFQDKRLGTGHAAKAGLSQVSDEAKNVLVVNGDDSAFYSTKTLEKVLKKHFDEGNTITFVTLEPDNPSGLGRIIRRGGRVVDIVEEKDANEEQKRIGEVNDGVYVFERNWFENHLPKIKRSRVGEYYLVDLIGSAASQGEKVGVLKLSDPGEWCGVNTLEELREADKQIRKRAKDAG